MNDFRNALIIIGKSTFYCGEHFLEIYLKLENKDNQMEEKEMKKLKFGGVSNLRRSIR